MWLWFSFNKPLRCTNWIYWAQHLLLFIEKIKKKNPQKIKTTKIKKKKKTSKKKNWKETVLSLSSRRRFLQLYFLSTEHLHTITTYYHYWLSLFSKMSSTVIWTWHLVSSYLLRVWWEMWKVLLHNMLKWNGTRLRISWFSSFTALRDT